MITFSKDINSDKHNIIRINNKFFGVLSTQKNKGKRVYKIVGSHKRVHYFYSWTQMNLYLNTIETGKDYLK